MNFLSVNELQKLIIFLNEEINSNCYFPHLAQIIQMQCMIMQLNYSLFFCRKLTLGTWILDHLCLKQSRSWTLQGTKVLGSQSPYQGAANRFLCTNVLHFFCLLSQKMMHTDRQCTASGSSDSLVLWKWTWNRQFGMIFKKGYPANMWQHPWRKNMENKCHPLKTAVNFWQVIFWSWSENSSFAWLFPKNYLNLYSQIIL